MGDERLMNEQTIHVLLVDDHPPNPIITLSNQLPPKTLQLKTTPTFQAALDVLRDQPMDVVLFYPSGAPHDEARIQQIHTLAPGAAVVAITSEADEAAGLAAVQAGAQDHLILEDMTWRTLVRTLREGMVRKQNMEALHQAEERLRIIFESVQDYAIFSTDKDGYINTWNVGAERLFEYTEAEIMGKRTDVLFTPEDRANDIPQLELKTALATGSASDDRWHLRKDGSRFFASGTVRPLYDGDKQFSGFAKVCRDMTERKLAEDERNELLGREQEARAQAERANRLKEIFVGMVSHELRTPLTSIIGFITTLMADDVTWTEEETRQFLDIINAEAQRMNSLIAQLLDISQQQAGTLSIRPEYHQLQDIVRQAMPQLNALTKQHHLVVSLPPDLPPLHIDSQRIMQVLVNLVDNAVKFSPPDSRVAITVRPASDVVQVEVSDQGQGIAPENQARIFEAFHQVGASTSSRRGIGLGLTITKGIVEAHGGRIWFESLPGQGTTFCFTLPLDPATAAVPPVERPLAGNL